MRLSDSKHRQKPKTFVFTVSDTHTARPEQATKKYGKHLEEDLLPTSKFFSLSFLHQSFLAALWDVKAAVFFIFFFTPSCSATA